MKNCSAVSHSRDQEFIMNHLFTNKAVRVVAVAFASAASIVSGAVTAQTLSGRTAAQEFRTAEVETVQTSDMRSAEVNEPGASSSSGKTDNMAEEEIVFIRTSLVKAINFNTVYRESSSIPEGEQRVLTKGENGILSVQGVKKIVDGKEEGFERTNEELTKAPKSEIILIGTGKMATPAFEEIDATVDDMPKKKKKKSKKNSEEAPEAPLSIYALNGRYGDMYSIPEDESFLYGNTQKRHDCPEQISLFDVPDYIKFDKHGVPKEYQEVFYGNSTAYTAPEGALMSTGYEVFQGYVAVDPNVIPYGSELYIVADDGDVYGYAIAADTGSAARHGQIIADLFMEDYDECLEWGRKDVTVYVLSGLEDVEAPVDFDETWN